jgi:hypothetical protein
MENLLQEIPFVVVGVDDILVSGSNDEEHVANLVQLARTRTEEQVGKLTEHALKLLGF